MRELSQHESVVLAAVECLGRPTLAELHSEVGGRYRELKRALDGLQNRGLLDTEGDPRLVYVGGVRYQAKLSASSGDASSRRDLTPEPDLERDKGEYTGSRIGPLIAIDGPVQLFATPDNRVVVHDARHDKYHELRRPFSADELRKWLKNPEEYAEACRALGIKPGG
jgi:hypothetical protein